MMLTFNEFIVEATALTWFGQLWGLSVLRDPKNKRPRIYRSQLPTENPQSFCAHLSKLLVDQPGDE